MTCSYRALIDEIRTAVADFDSARNWAEKVEALGNMRRAAQLLMTARDADLRRWAA